MDNEEEPTAAPTRKAAADDGSRGMMTREQLRKAIREAQRKMKAAAQTLDFPAAAHWRDEMQALQSQLDDAR